MKYVIVAVESEGQVYLGYAPDDSRIYYGDMVTLENGVTGIVMVKEDYENEEDMKKREKLHGRKLSKVVGLYREQEIPWEV